MKYMYCTFHSITHMTWLIILAYRYELRVRYLPKIYSDLLEKDKVSFFYFYDQVNCSSRGIH